VRLILVRHGQTYSNLEHLLDTAEPGAGLTALGEAQADALVDVLAGERLAAVVASPLLRTQQTAAPVARAHDLPVGSHAGLREILAGELEMRGDEDAAQQYFETMSAWAAGDLERRFPLGESGAEFFQRFDQGIAQVLSGPGALSGADGEDATALVVTHGAAMRLWVAVRARNVPLSQMERPMANTGVIVLTGEHGSWQVETWEGEAIGGPAMESAEKGVGGEPIRDEHGRVTNQGRRAGPGAAAKRRLRQPDIT